MIKKRHNVKYINNNTGKYCHVVQYFPMDKEVLLTGGIKITIEEFHEEYRRNA